MQAAIDLLRRELRALAIIISDNRAEIAAVRNGERIDMFHDTAAIHQEVFEIQQALELLQSRDLSRD